MPFRAVIKENVKENTNCFCRHAGALSSPSADLQSKCGWIECNFFLRGEENERLG